jgi:hypothetical protein
MSVMVRAEIIMLDLLKEGIVILLDGEIKLIFISKTPFEDIKNSPKYNLIYIG